MCHVTGFLESFAAPNRSKSPRSFLSSTSFLEVGEREDGLKMDNPTVSHCHHHLHCFIILCRPLQTMVPLLFNSRRPGFANRNAARHSHGLEVNKLTENLDVTHCQAELTGWGPPNTATGLTGWIIVCGGCNYSRWGL